MSQMTNSLLLKFNNSFLRVFIKLSRKRKISNEICWGKADRIEFSLLKTVWFLVIRHIPSSHWILAFSSVLKPAVP